MLAGHIMEVPLIAINGFFSSFLYSHRVPMSAVLVALSVTSGHARGAGAINSIEKARLVHPGSRARSGCDPESTGRAVD